MQLLYNTTIFLGQDSNHNILSDIKILATKPQRVPTHNTCVNGFPRQPGRGCSVLLNDGDMLVGKLNIAFWRYPKQVSNDDIKISHYYCETEKQTSVVARHKNRIYDTMEIGILEDFATLEACEKA